jgi:hypothetical protein
MSVVFLKISSLTDKTTSDAMRMPWLAKSCPFCHEKGELRKVIWGLPDKEPDESSYEIG